MKIFPRQRVKTKMLSIRVSPEDQDFLKGMRLSPTKIFDGALLKMKRRNGR